MQYGLMLLQQQWLTLRTFKRLISRCLLVMEAPQMAGEAAVWEAPNLWLFKNYWPPKLDGLWFPLKDEHVFSAVPTCYLSFWSLVGCLRGTSDVSLWHNQVPTNPRWDSGWLSATQHCLGIELFVEQLIVSVGMCTYPHRSATGVHLTVISHHQLWLYWKALDIKSLSLHCELSLTTKKHLATFDYYEPVWSNSFNTTMSCSSPQLTIIDHYQPLSVHR